MQKLLSDKSERNIGRGVLAAIILMTVVLALMSCAEEKVITPSEDKIHYTDIKPILDLKCATSRCHYGSDPAAGLGLESYEQVLKGSDNGPVVVPGNAAASFLYRTMTGSSAPVMPLEERLPQHLIDSVGRWIDDGLFESR